MVTFFLIMFSVVALGWVGYGLWEYKLRKEEQSMTPEQKRSAKGKSQRLQDAEKTFEDYARKMAEFKKKPHGTEKK